MEIYYSKVFQNQIKKIKKTNTNLYKKIALTVETFKNDQTANKFRLHKLTGSMYPLWSMSVDRSVRIILDIDWEQNITLLVTVGTHHQVYK